MKRLLTLGLISVTLFACQQDPQDKAAKEADKYENMAEDEAGAADAQLEQSMDNANAAMAHKSQAEMNTAIQQVEVPDFGNNTAANNIVKKIGNDGIDFMNANDYNQADKYSKKIENDLDEVNKLEEKGKISMQEADQIRQYAQNLADAVSIKVNVVVVPDTSASTAPAQ